MPRAFACVQLKIISALSFLCLFGHNNNNSLFAAFGFHQQHLFPVGIIIAFICISPVVAASSFIHNLYAR
jgi:hypothetical protein